MSFGIPVRNGLSVSLVSSTFLSSGRRLNPALNLDFLTGGPLDPRITFSRTSQATLVDSTGKLTYAPNNLLTNSESFEASAWNKFIAGTGVASTVTANAGVAPDGTATADLLLLNRGAGNTTGDSASISQQVVSTVGQRYVGSVYVKAATAGDIGKQIGFRHASGGSYLIVTLTADWVRISSPETAGSTTTNFDIVNRGGFTSGNSVSLLIWGAQLEQVTYQTTPGTYNSTSPKNLLGYTQEFDNAAWTKSNAFVQTNLLTYSQAFDNAAWVKGAVGTASAPVVTANAAVAPDGTSTADLIYFNRGAGTSGDRSTLVQAPTLSAGTYTQSVWLKAATSGDVGKQLALRNVAGGTYLTVTLTSSWVRYDRTEVWVANNWELANRQGITADIEVSAHVWGAQLVQGSTAGDYQRTDAAAAAVQYVAPDGSRTADKLVEDTATNAHGAGSSASAASTVVTWSIYAKSAERSWLRMASTSAALDTWFDLSSGTVGTVASGVTASITAISNGWYRCAITFAVGSGGVGSVLARISTGNNVIQYTGDGTSGIYIWGAQLSNSASLDPYVYNPVAAPTSAAYYGPRFDYDPVTLANKGLLIEEQRTNLLTYSQEFDNAAWPKQNATVTANAIVAPDGTTTADKLAEDASNTSHRMYQTTASAIANGTTVTNSVFLKAAERTWGYVRLELNDNTSLLAWFNLATGTIGTVQAGLTATMTSFGNGWYRCTVTGSVGTGATPAKNYFLVGTATGDTIQTYTGTSGSGIYVWGAQLEAGSFATSYIPTVASQVTRTADVALMQGANFSNWYNQNAGTWLAEWSPYAVTGSVVAQISAATNNDRFQILNDNSSQVGITTGGVGQGGVDAGTVSAGAANKLAFAYQTNDVPASLNGGAVVADTTVTIPVVDRLCIGATVAPAGFINGYIRRIGYYPTRLANEQLQSLTAQSTIPSLSLDFTTQVFNVG